MPVPFFALIWGIVVYAWVANYLIRMALGALLPPIIAELDLSYSSAGFLSTAFFYAYLAMQFPAGFLGDRFGRKRMLVTGVLVGVVASVLTGLAGSFVTLFLARLLTGLSQGMVFSNDRVIIAATTPRERMALGQGISFSGAGIGTTLGLFLAGVLGGMMPWRGVFLVFALPPLLAALLIWRIVPEPPRAGAAAGPVWPFRRLLRARDLWLVAVSEIMPVWVQFVLAIWGPLFFAEIGVTDLGVSAGLASLQGVVAPIGLVVSGLLADRLHARGIHRKTAMAAGILLMAASVVVMGLTIQHHGPVWLLTAAILGASFFMWCSYAPSLAIFGGVIPAPVLGRAFGIFNTTCFLGAIVGPVVIGGTKDLTGSFAPGLYATAALACLGLASAMAVRPAWRLAAS
jgi:MFS family permease